MKKRGEGAGFGFCILLFFEMKPRRLWGIKPLITATAFLKNAAAPPAVRMNCFLQIPEEKSVRELPQIFFLSVMESYIRLPYNAVCFPE